MPLQPFQPLGTQQISKEAPGPQGIPNTPENSEPTTQRAQKPPLPHPLGASRTTRDVSALASALSLTPAGSEKTSQEEEDGFNVLHERKIRGRRPTGTLKWQLEPCCQLHEHSRQDLTSAEFPGFQRRRARGRKREAQRHTQQHHSWEPGLCNKAPVSGSELRAIKTAATDLGETAGIYPRNPDYVATAEEEQKAPSSWKAKSWQVMSNQLHYPTFSASPTRVRASSQHTGGRGATAAGPASRQSHQGEGEDPSVQATRGPGCSRQGQGVLSAAGLLRGHTASQAVCGPKDKGSPTLQAQQCGFPFCSIFESTHRVTSTREKRQDTEQSHGNLPSRAGSWEQPQTLQGTPERNCVLPALMWMIPKQSPVPPLIHRANSPWLQLVLCASTEWGNVTGTGSSSGRSLENSTSPSPTTNSAYLLIPEE